jgi:hypothetical protein
MSYWKDGLVFTKKMVWISKDRSVGIADLL